MILIYRQHQASDASQGPGKRREAPCYRCPGAPWRRSQGVPLPIAPLTGSCPRRDTRRQSFPWLLGVRGLSGRHVSPRNLPSSPPRRLQKVSLGGGRSKLTPSDTQSVRTEQPDDAQASSAPRHLDGPRRIAISLCWTLAHVDHRLKPPNCLLRDLSHYIRDKVGPKGERILVRSPDTPSHSICLRSAPRVRQPREGAPRASPPSHPAVSFLSDEGDIPLAARQP
jgi:hypothetical protein